MCNFNKRLQIMLLITVVSVIIEVQLKTVDLTRTKCSLTCKEPQARAARVANLINSTTKVSPYMTIIHRCDEGTGCCMEKGTICTVTNQEDVEIKVHIKVNNRNYRLQTFTIQNHTECSCNFIDDEIK